MQENANGSNAILKGALPPHIHSEVMEYGSEA